MSDEQRQRGRYYDILLEALDIYDDWMLDDDYDSLACLQKMVKLMRRRLEMSDPPSDAVSSQKEPS
jgi:hypothetical protein